MIYKKAVIKAKIEVEKIKIRIKKNRKKKIILTWVSFM